MRRGTGAWREAMRMVAAIGAMLLLPGCLGTFGAAAIGEDQPQDQAQTKVASGPQIGSPAKSEKPVEMKQEEKQKQDDPGFRIRQLLDEAEQYRRWLFENAGYNSFVVDTDKKDENNNPIFRTYSLVTFAERGDAIRGARERYEMVLVRDPANPQALLGLADMALIDAMTLLTDQQTIDARLVTSPDLQKSEITRLTRKKELLTRRIDSSLKAAQDKFRRVLAISPSEPSAHLGVGMALAMARNWNAAHQKFDQMQREGLEPVGNRSVLYVWDGFVLERLGKKDAAIERYSSAAMFQEPYSWGDWASQRVEDLYIYE